jgi:lipid-binding SYLF domain-containing protein
MNATATGTAGAETGSEHLSTDDLEHREVIVYRDSGGIYGGATLGGSSIEQKQSINEEAYGDNVRTRNILDGSVPPPQSASGIYAILNASQQ